MARMGVVLARSRRADERKSGQRMRACIEYAAGVRRDLLGRASGSQAGTVHCEQREAGRLRIPILASRRQPQRRATCRRERKIDDRIGELIYNPSPYGRDALVDMRGLRCEERL